MATNRKLEELFGMAPPPKDDPETTTYEEDEEEIVSQTLTTSTKTLVMIEQALPAVQELALIDKELDEIAAKAMSGYEELSDLGMQVDSRFASEIFSVASSMLGHALSAKTAKANRKLKTIEMQMKKIRLEMDMQKKNATDAPAEVPYEQADGKVLSRNELMEQLLGSRGAAGKDNSEI